MSPFKAVEFLVVAKKSIGKSSSKFRCIIEVELAQGIIKVATNAGKMQTEVILGTGAKVS